MQWPRCQAYMYLPGFYGLQYEYIGNDASGPRARAGE